MAKPRLDPERTLTPAEKQKRHREKQQSKADRLRGLLYSLERAVWEASDRGDALADVVKAGNVETLIENLTRHFEAVGKPDVNNAQARVSALSVPLVSRRRHSLHMAVHGVNRILTFNTTDFARFPFLNAVHPKDV